MIRKIDVFLFFKIIDRSEKGEKFLRIILNADTGTHKCFKSCKNCWASWQYIQVAKNNVHIDMDMAWSNRCYAAMANTTIRQAQYPVVHARYNVSHD